MSSAHTAITRSRRNVRRLLLGGTALPLALLAAPAQAECVVDGTTTTCTSSGNVSTISDGAPAILALGDEVTVVSTGDLTTTGIASGGIVAVRGYTYDPVEAEAAIDSSGVSASVTSVGNISTSGEDSFGIAAAAINGPASVHSTGNITTAGEDSYGIVASGQTVSIVSDGAVTTGGDTAHGIFAPGLVMVDGETEAMGGIPGDVTIVAGTVATSGLGAMGIRAISENGSVSVTADSVTTTGENDTGDDGGAPQVAEAVFAESTNGSVTLDVGSSEAHGLYTSSLIAIAGGDATITAGSATNHGELASNVYAKAAGNVNVTVGTITSTGSNGEGAALQSTGGTVDFSVDTISVGDFARAAYISSAGDVNVAIGAATGGTGVRVVPTAGDVTITAGSIETWSFALRLDTIDGGNIVVDAGELISKIDTASTVMASALGGGTVTVDVDEASSAGNDRATLHLTTDSGDINVTGGAITASGNSGRGVHAHSTDGDISVNLDSVATTGLELISDFASEGILADSINGTSTIVVGTASAEGFGASAAVALGGAGASVTAETASGAGEGAAILYAGSMSGNATVDAGTVTLRGNNQGAANAVADQGVATITIDSVVDEGTLSSGVIARGGQGASVTAGDISVDRFGAYAVALNGSAATVVSTGNTTTATGFGLRANGGTASISTAEGTTTQAGHHAIWGQGTESVTIDNQGTASTSGGLSSAIFAQSGGDVSITSAIAQALGAGADPGIGENGFRIAQGGIVANGAGTVSIDAETVTVEGEYRYGIHAFGGEGVTINADNVTLASADSAAVSGNSGTGAVNITTGTVTTTGVSGAGVVGRTDSGDITIVADTTRVESGGIQGPFTGDAVVGLSNTGTVSVTSADAFSAAYGGSAAVALGGSASVSSGLAETTGDNGIALYALAYTGDASVTADQTLVSGDDAMGIFARSNQGNASVVSDTLISTGTVNTSGIFVRAMNGTASIVTTGDTSVAGGYGLQGTGGNVEITTGADTLTEAAGNAIWADATQSVVVNNQGTVRSTDYGSAIFAESGGSIDISSLTTEVTGPGIDPGADENGMRWPQGGIIANAAGAVSIDADTVTVEGEYRYGIHAFGGEGVTIDANNVTLASADSVAVAGKSDAGAVSITTGTVITTGASGVGVFAETTSGDISVVAGTTRVENEGYQGLFTGDAVVAISETGNVSVTSEDAFSAALYGTAAAAIGHNVTLHSGKAETTGDSGIAVYGFSATGDVSVTADETILAGESANGIFSRSNGGNASIHAGSITSTGSAGTIGAWVRADNGTASLVTTGDVQVVGGVGLRGQGATVVIETGEDTVTHGGTMGIFANASGTTSVFNNGVASGVTRGINAIAAGDVTIDSLTATASGAAGLGIYGQSNGGTLTIDAQLVTTSGDNSTAVQGFAFNGPGANVRVGDITATGANSFGVHAGGRFANVTVDGDVSTTGRGVLASGGIETHVQVNGSVTTSEANAAGVITVSHHGVVDIAEGASVHAGGAGVIMLGNEIGGFGEFYNSGTVHGENGPAVFAGQSNPDFAPASYYIQNNGVLTSNGAFVVVTGAGNDTLELTNLSQITGIADLGDGEDRLVLDLNDDAPAGAVGQVVSTINVESLHVDSGSWLANGIQSQYGLLEIEEGATLTIVENGEGSLAIEAEVVELDGQVNIDLSVDETEEDFGEALVTGIGSIHLIGTARVILTDTTNLQHTGGTYVENGTLQLVGAYGGDIVTSGTGTFQLGDGGTTGDFTGDIVNNGNFVFSRSDDYSFLGDFTGSGSLVKDGAGVLTFAGLYDFTGTTTVNGGRIAFVGQLSEDTEVDLSGEGTVDLSQISSGEQEIAQLSGTGGTVVLGTTNLVVNQTSDTVFEGAIVGTSTLTKTGEGDLKLNGDGTGFTGTGEVQGGTLSVNGDYSNASFVVEPSGTLGGSGTVGSTSVNGGTLAAGNSIGQLTVNGNLTFTAASVLEVEVNAAGQADRVDATGTATLAGATVNVLAEAGNYAPITNYTILTAAGGVNGTFGTVNSNLAYLVPLLSYTVNTVTLRLERNDVDFSAYTTDPNSIVVGGLIESLGYGTPLYNAALMLSTAQASTDFATLTGDIYPVYSATLVETANSIRQQTARPMGSGTGAYAWGQGLAGSLKADGNGGRGYKASNTGVAGGLGFAGLGFDVSAGLGQLWQDPSQSQVTDSDITFALLQAAYNGPAGFYANGGVQFGWVDAGASRATQLGTLATTVVSEFDAKYTNLNGEVGIALPLTGVSVQPFAGLSHVSLNIDGFSETGGATALTVGDLDRDVTFGDLGVRLSTAMPGPFSAYGSAAYRMAWGDRASTGRVAFAGNTAGGLVTGLPLAKSAAEIGAGIRYNAGRIGIGLEYNGTFSKAFDSNNVSAKLSIAF